MSTMRRIIVVWSNTITKKHIYKLIMLNNLKYINYSEILSKKKVVIKKKIKINCFLLHKDLYIYNGKSYIFRKFNVFFLKKNIHTNVLFKKPLAKPMKKKKK